METIWKWFSWPSKFLIRLRKYFNTFCLKARVGLMPTMDNPEVRLDILTTTTTNPYFQCQFWDKQQQQQQQKKKPKCVRISWGMKYEVESAHYDSMHVSMPFLCFCFWFCLGLACFHSVIGVANFSSRLSGSWHWTFWLVDCSFIASPCLLVWANGERFLPTLCHTPNGSR